MEADEIGGAQKSADASLATAQKDIEAEKKTIAADTPTDHQNQRLRCRNPVMARKRMPATIMY